MHRSTVQRLGILALALATLLAAPSATPEAAPVEFSIGGNTTAASIQGTVDAFRAAVGDPNNANAPGPLTTGRREINWDGGGATNNAPGVTPFNVFLNIRGAQFVTPGTGFVQAPASAVGTNDDLGTFFGNATYDTTFGFFSPVRVFTPTGSNITDAFFAIPGTNGSAQATVSGFGAVFTDVDLAGSTSIQYFDINDTLLFSQAVLPGTVPNQSLSFAGVVFNAGERVARVQIITGNTPLSAAANDGGSVDLVVVDDFVYREPEAVLEPSVLFLLASGLGGLGIAGWRRRR
jgi:hypothetical protein